MERKFRLCGLLICSLFAGLYSQAITERHSVAELGARDLQITFHSFAEYPDVCQDQRGNIWIAYSELKAGYERIVLKKIHNFTVADSFIVNRVDGLEAFPRIACDTRNRIWITWCAKRKNSWDIYARYREDDRWSDEICITDETTDDLHPAIGITPENDIWISWESSRDGNFDILATRLINDQPIKPVSISGAAEMDLRPAIVPKGGNDIAIIWDRQKDSGYRVLMKSLDKQGWSNEIAISPAVGFNHSAAAAFDRKGNLTVVWQTNLRPDGVQDYNHWLLARQIRPTKPGDYLIIEEPGDRRKIREDQGLEFPTALYDRSGRLWLFSRASQDFYAQCIFKEQKSPLYHFDIAGWGGRGIHVRAIPGNDGFLYTVRRDLKYIYLNRFDAEKADLKYDNNLRTVAEYPVRSDEQLPALPSPEPRVEELKLPDGYHFYFGDIHQHSALSDGMGSADECFTRSRLKYHQDFAALTDHEWFTNNYILPSEWEWLKMVGRNFTCAGEFTVIPAYEWTTPRLPDGFGHKNVYFPSFDAPLFSYRFEAETAGNLLKLLEPLEAIAIPHHVAWTGTDWESFDSQLQPVAEIVSTHGVFEYMGNEPIMHRGGIPGNFIRDGLLMGKKFGLVGGSDGHGLKWHHGIGYKESEFTSGLTVAIAKENSLKAIFEAIRARRVYATSGSRIFIDFRIDGEWMGSDITTNQKPSIALRVKGSAPLHKVEVIRDGEPILILGKDATFGLGVNRTFTDSKVQPGPHFYYLRILQEDGEMAWSSPIWVNLTGS